MASCATLADEVRDARQHTLGLVEDLTDEQLVGPRLPTVNPMLWEIGHVAWFQERWVLRHAAGRAPLRSDGDALYDSSAVPHDTRWDLPLPSRAETLQYLATVRDEVLTLLGHSMPDALEYFVRLSVFHEDMHNEAFTITRQTLGYAAPKIRYASAQPESGVIAAGDAKIPGGSFPLGADAGEPFVFDNEKWAHRVEVLPFSIARTAVTQGEFAAFVDDGGYERRALWDDQGWRWRCQAAARLPVYWKREGGGYLRRHFDEWLSVEPSLPMLHVSWFEAQAYCRWAGRRLPSEIEWEVAAAGEPDERGQRLTDRKRRYPWGDSASDSLAVSLSDSLAGVDTRARLDWTGMRCGGVHELAAGDSAFGCRQMIGNVWEWTSADFLPYPGFVADPYRDYSQPWFGTHKVLRGGCFATRARLLRNTWRNFYPPDRRDVFAGFRTCALDERDRP